ncbi:gag-pol polyprotein [Tanacetum coccineum]
MRGRSMESGSSGSHNHGKSKTGKKKNFKCFKCGKPGNFSKDCRGLNTSYAQGNVTITSEDGNALCCEAPVANERRKRFADLKGEIIEEAKASVASHSPSHKVAVTWHQKLRHMSEQGMKILIERKLLPGLTKINDSDYQYQYAVSIKEDTAYPCMQSPKTTKETNSIRRIQRRPIRRIEDIVCEDCGRYQA